MKSDHKGHQELRQTAPTPSQPSAAPIPTPEVLTDFATKILNDFKGRKFNDVVGLLCTQGNVFSQAKIRIPPEVALCISMAYEILFDSMPQELQFTYAQEAYNFAWQAYQSSLLDSDQKFSRPVTKHFNRHQNSILGQDHFKIKAFRKALPFLEKIMPLEINFLQPDLSNSIMGYIYINAAYIKGICHLKLFEFSSLKSQTELPVKRDQLKHIQIGMAELFHAANLGNEKSLHELMYWLFQVKIYYINRIADAKPPLLIEMLSWLRDIKIILKRHLNCVDATYKALPIYQHIFNIDQQFDDLLNQGANEATSELEMKNIKSEKFEEKTTTDGKKALVIFNLIEKLHQQGKHIAIITLAEDIKNQGIFLNITPLKILNKVGVAYEYAALNQMSEEKASIQLSRATMYYQQVDYQIRILSEISLGYFSYTNNSRIDLHRIAIAWVNKAIENSDEKQLTDAIAILIRIPNVYLGIAKPRKLPFIDCEVQFYLGICYRLLATAFSLNLSTELINYQKSMDFFLTAYIHGYKPAFEKIFEVHDTMIFTLEKIINRHTKAEKLTTIKNYIQQFIKEDNERLMKILQHLLKQLKKQPIDDAIFHKYLLPYLKTLKQKLQLIDQKIKLAKFLKKNLIEKIKNLFEKRKYKQIINEIENLSSAAFSQIQQVPTEIFAMIGFSYETIALNEIEKLKRKKALQQAKCYYQLANQPSQRKKITLYEEVFKRLDQTQYYYDQVTFEFKNDKQLYLARHPLTFNHIVLNLSQIINQMQEKLLIKENPVLRSYLHYFIDHLACLTEIPKSSLEEKDFIPLKSSSPKIELIETESKNVNPEKNTKQENSLDLKYSSTTLDLKHSLAAGQNTQALRKSPLHTPAKRSRTRIHNLEPRVPHVIFTHFIDSKSHNATAYYVDVFRYFYRYQPLIDATQIKLGLNFYRALYDTDLHYEFFSELLINRPSIFFESIFNLMCTNFFKAPEVHYFLGNIFRVLMIALKFCIDIPAPEKLPLLRSISLPLEYRTEVGSLIECLHKQLNKLYDNLHGKVPYSIFKDNFYNCLMVFFQIKFGLPNNPLIFTRGLSALETNVYQQAAQSGNSPVQLQQPPSSQIAYTPPTSHALTIFKPPSLFSPDLPDSKQMSLTFIENVQILVKALNPNCPITFNQKSFVIISAISFTLLNKYLRVTDRGQGTEIYSNTEFYYSVLKVSFPNFADLTIKLIHLDANSLRNPSKFSFRTPKQNFLKNIYFANQDMKNNSVTSINEIQNELILLKDIFYKNPKEIDQIKKIIIEIWDSLNHPQNPPTLIVLREEINRILLTENNTYKLARKILNIGYRILNITAVTAPRYRF